MRLTALHTGIIVALMAVVVLTYAALTVDYYSWELEFSLWLQGFSLGRADSLRELLFWVGVREVSGVALLVVCVVLWLRRWRLEAIFVALVSVPDLLNILIKELIGRPGQPRTWWRWSLATVAYRAPAFPAATQSMSSCSTGSCSFWRACTYPTRPWCGPYLRWGARTSWLLVRGSSTTVATGWSTYLAATAMAHSTCWR